MTGTLDPTHDRLAQSSEAFDQAANGTGHGVVNRAGFSCRGAATPLESGLRVAVAMMQESVADGVLTLAFSGSCAPG